MLPVAISASTAGVIRAAVAAAVSPRSAGRAISPWLIGMPPNICARYSPAADADQKLFDVAEATRLHHPVGVAGELTDRLDVGCEPGKPVGGALLAVKRARIGPAVAHDASGDRQTGVRQQPLRGRNPLS